MPELLSPHASQDTRQGFRPPLQALLLWQSLALFWFCGLLAARWPLPALVTAGLVLWVDQRVRRTVPLCTALFLLGLGAIVALSLLPSPSPAPPWILEQSKGHSPRLEGVVHKVQGLPDQRWRIFLRDVRPMHASDRAGNSGQSYGQDKVHGLVTWTWDKPPAQQARPVKGQRVRVSAPLRESTGFRNPGLPDFGEYWATQNVFWRLWTRGQGGAPEFLDRGDNLALLREEGRRALVQALLPSVIAGQSPHSPPALSQAQAFIPALLFGDRFHLSSETMRRMGAASLVHSLALSGQHLALAVLCAALLTHILVLCLPHLYLHIPRIKLVALLSLPLGGLYLWLGGAPPSLVRAFAMLALAALLLRLGTVRTLTDVILLALLGITLVQPLALFDMGLQLSVLCVAAIALLLPLLRRLPGGKPTDLQGGKGFLRRTLRGMGQLALVSLGIQLALLPLALHYFPTQGQWFALNVLWLPVLGFWVLPLGALGLLLAWGGVGLAEHVLTLAVWPCEALLWLLDWLDARTALDFPALLRPHWSTLPGWAALFTALAMLPGRLHKEGGRWSALPAPVQRLALAAALLLLLGPLQRYASQFTAPVSLSMLDVGQGQALHLGLPGGVSVLVDGGGSTSSRFDPGEALVIPFLSNNRAPRLQAVCSTHPDMDHLRGLLTVLQRMQVAEYFDNGEKARGREAALLRTAPIPPGHALTAGMQIELPGNSDVHLEVLHPPSAPHQFSGNNASLVLRLSRGGKGLALLMGDVEIPALRALLASGQRLDAEVLVLPHHGSRHSLLPELYDAVQPRLALASCGKNNRFGFPAPEVRQALARRGIALYSTAQHGAVQIFWNKNDELMLKNADDALRHGSD